MYIITNKDNSLFFREKSKEITLGLHYSTIVYTKNKKEAKKFLFYKSALKNLKYTTDDFIIKKNP